MTDMNEKTSATSAADAERDTSDNRPVDPATASRPSGPEPSDEASDLAAQESERYKFDQSKSGRSETEAVEPPPPRVLPAAAQRALAEAEARRAAAQAAAPVAKEFQGPDGPEPTRFGDWERKGIASDF